MGINLNEDKYNKQEVSIFNNGLPGVVNNVSVTVEKKSEQDKDTAPDYKVVFTDSNGSSANMPFWYIKEATSRKSIDQQIDKQGQILKHLTKTICGESYTFPDYDNATQMLDGVMKTIRSNSGDQKFRTFANFGNSYKKGAYIGVRDFVPFIESMNVPIENTILKADPFDSMEAVKKDVVNSNSGSSDNSANEEDEEW